jgi:hypothetical protein
LKPTSNFVVSLGPEPNINVKELDYSKVSINSGVTASLSVIKDYAADDLEWYNSFKSNTYQLVQSIVSEKDLIEKIYNHLGELDHNISTEFKELVDLYNSSKTNVGLNSSLGIKMRNVLEHFKGICNKAAVIERDGEYKGQSTLTWKKIAENVARNGPKSKYANDLYKLTSIYNSLWGGLSSEAKDYTNEDSEHLSESFYITIKFLSDFFDLADFAKIKRAVS